MAKEGCGLAINEQEFMSLPPKQQMCTLFQNQVKQFEKLDKIEEMLEGYKFHQKIQYVWLGTLTTGFLGYIAKYTPYVLSSILVLI